MRSLGICLLCATALIIGGVSSAASADDARQCWERVILAKGGRAKLQAIDGLVVSSHMTRERGPRLDVAGAVQYEQVVMFPDRLWAWGDYRPGSMGFGVQVWNRATRNYWTALDGGLAETQSWDRLSESGVESQLRELQVVHLLETRFLQPTPVRIVREDQSAVVLEATAPGYASIQYTIDRQSQLPKKIVFRPLVTPVGSGPEYPASFTSTVTLEGFVDLGGIRMPKIVGGLGEVSYIINPAIDPKLFETRPDNVTRADVWKSFLRK